MSPRIEIKMLLRIVIDNLEDTNNYANDISLTKKTIKMLKTLLKTNFRMTSFINGDKLAIYVSHVMQILKKLM